ncbi:MAG: STAS domain-containing protein [Betaproteobacteria bacterium]
MQVTEHRFANALLLKVSGRIDRDTADTFKSALEPHLQRCRVGGDVLLLDFSDLQYISSLGFQVLLLAQRKAKTQSGSFGVAALQPAVKTVFDVANLAKVIRCHDTVELALAEMSHTARIAYMQSK